MTRTLAISLTALLVPLTPLAAQDESAPAVVHRRLYVADRPSGLSVYDIDEGHALLRRIELPGTGAYKGIAASVPLGRLYLTSNAGDELVCLDLATDRILWRKQYGSYVDSLAVTPDGRTLYVPCRHDRGWWVLDAEDGLIKAVIETGRGQQYAEHSIEQHGPHNTWISPDGARAYLGLLTVPYVLIADTATHEIIGRIGPFSRGVRPFTVSSDERFLYANVDMLRGFEVAAVRDVDGSWGGAKLYRVEAPVPDERFRFVRQHRPPDRPMPHLTPCHGINLSPDGQELWLVDGVYGYVYVYDATVMPPRRIAEAPLFRDPADPADMPQPGWVSFSIDGAYAYPDRGPVIDTATKRPVAWIDLTEKLIEVRFDAAGRVIAAGQR